MVRAMSVVPVTRSAVPGSAHPQRPRSRRRGPGDATRSRAGFAVLTSAEWSAPPRWPLRGANHSRASRHRSVRRREATDARHGGRDSALRVQAVETVLRHLRALAAIAAERSTGAQSALLAGAGRDA